MWHFCRAVTSVGGGPLVVRPRDVEHLRELVVETLEVMTGTEVFVDEDGDVVVPCGEQSLIWVGPDLDRPVVSITAILVDRVSRPQAGLAALNLVSGRLPFASARMLGSRLTITHELHAMPFVPEHLAGWVARCQVEIDEVAVEAALLLGGERYLENLDQPRPAPVLDRLADARTHPRRRVALRPTIQTALLDDQPDLFESGPGPTG